MKNNVLIFALIIACSILLIGCGGALIRGINTGDSYSEMASKMPVIEAGNGRLFIYMVGKGPDIMTTAGSIDFVSVDRKVLRYGGKSFVYIDVQKGKHLLSTNGVFVKKVFGHEWKYGKNKFEIELGDSETKYIKISDDDLTMSEVNVTQAQKELKELPYYKVNSTNAELSQL